jgi:hypothetical protein
MANGDYHLTDFIRDRIISMMPIFLSDSAKHKLGIHEYITIIKNTVKAFQSVQCSNYRNKIHLNNITQVIEVFQKEYQKISSLTIHQPRFNILTEEEKSEALEICKYIIRLKLQNTFDSIERDFNIFLPFMNYFTKGIISSKYFIPSFNIEIEITDKGQTIIEMPNFNIIEIETNSRYKIFADKYLAYELISLYDKRQVAISNSFLNRNDLQLFFNQYEEFIKSENEIKINSSFQGEGGVLLINVHLKPLIIIKTSISKTISLLLLYMIITVIIISLAIVYKLWVILIYGCLFLGGLALGLVSEQIRKLKSLIIELKLNGKQ